LQSRKHCGDLLAAYLKIFPSMRVKPYLLIIGDGEERASLETRIKQLGAFGASNVRLLGFRNQTELPRYFELCSVFILPSRHEPWGLVVNEAMNAARAVIVSNEVGCHPDLVHNTINGFVYPAGNIDALATALRTVLITPEVSAQMGRQSLKIISNWGFDQDVAGLVNALHNVCKMNS